MEGKTRSTGILSLPVITYSKPSDEYGALGNMAGGMPIVINGHKIYASEHLYLCGYWSLNTDLHRQAQEYCLSQKSGVYAKRCTKGKYYKDARADFHGFKYYWMIWVVWQKAQQNKSRNTTKIYLIKVGSISWGKNCFFRLSFFRTFMIGRGRKTFKQSYPKFPLPC